MVVASNSGGVPGGRWGRTPHWMRSTVAMIKTPVGSEFSQQNHMDRCAKDEILLHGDSKHSSGATSTTTWTYTTDMENAPCYRVCMGDDYVTSQCPFSRTNPDIIHVRIENLESLRSTRGEKIGAPSRGHGNGRGNRSNSSGPHTRGSGVRHHTPYTNRSGTGMRTANPENHGRRKANPPSIFIQGGLTGCRSPHR